MQGFACLCNSIALISVMEGIHSEINCSLVRPVTFQLPHSSKCSRKAGITAHFDSQITIFATGWWETLAHEMM